MTSYSYLKESELEDSGYTRGLKTGSFNYLEEGDINYNETILYRYGNNSIYGNSSVTHKMDLEFNGTKGISEFYGKGFFHNNRAISAWKKIRYDNLSREVPGLGEARMANYIKVDASVSMNTNPSKGRVPYDFRYTANVEDAVVDVRDAAGWTNRTAATAVDWEHDAYMSGDLNISNNLTDYTLFFPAAGTTPDWLSCCIGGGDQLRLEIESEDEPPEWPNKGTWSTLKPSIIKPEDKTIATVEYIQECTEDCTKMCNSAVCVDVCNITCKRVPTGNVPYKNFTCNETSCPGFEGILTCEAGPMGRALGDLEETARESMCIHVENNYLGDTEKRTNYTFDVSKDPTNITLVTYEILVKNCGGVRLEDVVVNVTLPANVKYNSSRYLNTSLGDLEADTKTDENGMTKTVNWTIGSLDTNVGRNIVLKIMHKSDDDVKYEDVLIEASGLGLGTIPIDKGPVRATLKIEEIGGPGG